MSNSLSKTTWTEFWETAAKLYRKECASMIDSAKRVIRCDTCKHWSRTEAEKGAGHRGQCSHRATAGNPVPEHFEHSAIMYACGPNFGCIHWDCEVMK